MTFPLYSTILPFAKPFSLAFFCFSSSTSLIPFCLPLLNSPEALLNSFPIASAKGFKKSIIPLIFCQILSNTLDTIFQILPKIDLKKLNTPPKTFFKVS